MAESEWMKHAKKYRKANGALDLQAAAKTYKKSGSKKKRKRRKSASSRPAAIPADSYGSSLRAQRAYAERRRQNRRRLAERMKIRELERQVAESEKGKKPTDPA